MKKYKFLAIAVLAAATTVMTSCSKNDEAVNNSNERVEVKFSANTADIQTRVDGTSWTADDRIGIYMLAGDYSLSAANISEGVNNREYKAAAGASAAFTPVGDIIYYPTAGDVKFIAYYPYGAVTDFTRGINLSDQSSQSAIDYLYAAADGTYNKNSGTVTLPFKHKLVKLEFTLENGAGVTAALNGLTVAISNQATTGTMNLTNGSVATTNSDQTITLTSTANGTKAEAIVFEGSQTGKFTFTNTAGEAFIADIPDNFEAGKKYAYTVTLQKKSAGIQGSISDWGGTGTSTSVEAK